MRRTVLSLAFLGIVMVAPMLLGSCVAGRDHDDVRQYFERGKVGASPDVGLMKRNRINQEWDYVATIHGMDDDMAFCQDVVSSLGPQFPRQEYSCSVLNR